MENNEETTQEESKDSTKDKKEGVQSEATTDLDRADQIAERQKRENDRREELLTREEALAARKAVGGITEAGSEPVKKEETSKEYAEKVMANDGV